MKATEILYEEHLIIMKVLECLDKMSEAAEKNARLDAKAANLALDFFRNFADGCHHAKEEDRLFVVMEENGVPREDGPIAVMLSEHEAGRRCVRGMASSVDEAALGDAQAIEKFKTYAFEFAILLRAHIEKEDNVLFPMANNVLGQRSEQTLLADFRAIETKAGGKRHSQYIEVAQCLCKQFGVPFVEGAHMPTIRSEFLVQ